MLGNNHYYNRTIRKIVVAFGTIFNDIYLVRYSADGTVAKEKFKVPLSYGSKEKYITRLTSDPDLVKSIATTVPRISFEMTGMNYDSTRKLQTTQRNFSAGSTSTTVKTQYTPVPYNFDFSMSIYVRNTEDGTQILEQILPFFTPDFNVTVDFVPGMDNKYDMPVLLTSVSNETDYEGDMMSTRLIIWNLEFTAKSYIWPAVQSGGKIIRQANTSVSISTDAKNTQQFTVDYANGSNYFSDTEIVRTQDGQVWGKVAYFSNTSIGNMVVTDLNGVLKVGDVLLGDYTNAKYTISTMDNLPIKSTLVITVPAPITANVDDEFGFSETIYEAPNIP